MVRPEASTKSMSTYERYQKIGEVKKAWKNEAGDEDAGLPVCGVPGATA